MTDPLPYDKGVADSMVDDDAGQIPPPVPDHVPSGQSAAESFEEDTRNQLNLLRDRTFNAELKQLVDRVRENEPSASVFDDEPEEAASLSEDELRLRLYRLYYRARVLNDNREMNVAFNPFGFIDGSNRASTHAAISDYILDRMGQLSLSPFALLSYRIAEKGYIPAVHNLERYHVENIVISLHDMLFRTILESGEGVILEADTLRDDPFLEKIFSLHEGEDPRALYFVMLSSLVSDVAQELQRPGQTDIVPFLPSAILMIELPLQTAAHNRGSIFTALRKKLALPFFLLNDNQSLVFSSESYEDMAYSYHVLDYLFTIFLLNHDRIGISIISKLQDDSSRSFLMKYIISQLSYKLHADSVLVHIIKGHLIILTREVFVDLIRSLIDEYNKLFNGQFVVVEFRPEEFEDSLEIIQRIILKIKNSL
jgi:hypothetical protein